MAQYVPAFRPGDTVTFSVTADVTGGRYVEVGSADLAVAPAGGASVKVVGVAAYDAKVGDKVVARHTQALVLELKKGGAGIRERAVSTDQGSAQPGDKPAAYEAMKVTFTADVVKVDAKKHVITLRGPERTVKLKIKDPEQIKLIKKGDQVEGVYAEAVALSVEAAPAKAKKQ